MTALTGFRQRTWVPTWLFGPFFSYVRLWCIYEHILLDTPSEMPDGSVPATVVVFSKAWSSHFLTTGLSAGGLKLGEGSSFLASLPSCTSPLLAHEAFLASLAAGLCGLSVGAEGARGCPWPSVSTIPFRAGYSNLQGKGRQQRPCLCGFLFLENKQDLACNARSEQGHIAQAINQK